MSFDIKELKKDTNNNNRYDRRIAILVEKNQDTTRIKFVVDNALANIKSNQRSFVIFG